MADAALSVSSSALTTLLATGSADQPTATSAGAAKSADPFAALLASASDGKPQIAVAKNVADGLRTPDPISALLAGTASVSAAPVTLPAPKVLPATAAQSMVETASPVVDMPVEAHATADAPASDESDDGDAKPDGQSKDPLADAIASGATAVLALAPAIVAPPVIASTPTQATTPAPIRIDGAAAPIQRTTLVTIPHPGQAIRAEMAGPPTTAIIASPLVPTDQSQPAPVPTEDSTRPQAPQPVRSKPQLEEASTSSPKLESFMPVSEQPIVQRQNSTDLPQPPSVDPNSPAPAQSDARAPKHQAPSSAPAPEKPALPTDNAKMAVAFVQQGDEAPATGDAPVAPVRVAAPKSTTSADTRPVATQQSRSEQATVHAPVRRRPTEAPTPRRTADMRRRVDVAANDGSVPGANQRGPEPGVITEAAAPSAMQSKGDAVIQQTLTIGRDGAWLDRLARDIASASNGGDLQFKLDPEHLGSLTVAITQSADGASIRLTADNDTTRNLLLDAQPKLLAEARAQGLKVSDTHVDLNQNQAQNQNQGQNQNQNQHQSHSQTANQDPSRWAQNGSGQNGGAQNGQNRQSSPGHQPFVSNLRRKAEADTESSDGDSGARYA